MTNEQSRMKPESESPLNGISSLRLLERGGERLQELREVERFDEDALDTERGQLVAAQVIRLPGAGDHAHGRIEPTEHPDQAEAIHRRHNEIGEHETDARSLPCIYRDCFHPILCQ